MGRPPSIQWYYKQWLGDNKVLAMEWDAQGMHFHLLMMSIQETPSGSIPNDVALIRRWLRLPSGQSESDRVWARVQPQIFAAWTLENERWFNSGMVETAVRQEKYRKRYETGTRNSANLNADEVSIKDCEVSNSKSNTTARPNPEVITPDDAVHCVTIELGLGGSELRRVLQEQIFRQLEKVGIQPKDTAEAMVLAWRIYEQTDVEFRKGPVKFFSDGSWRKSPDEWKRKSGKTNELLNNLARAKANIR